MSEQLGLFGEINETCIVHLVTECPALQNELQESDARLVKMRKELWDAERARDRLFDEVSAAGRVLHGAQCPHCAHREEIQ
jgi:hypothetical protein